MDIGSRLLWRRDAEKVEVDGGQKKDDRDNEAEAKKRDQKQDVAEIRDSYGRSEPGVEPRTAREVAQRRAVSLGV